MITLSGRRSLSYKNQSKSVDLFLYEKNLSHERIRFRQNPGTRAIFQTDEFLKEFHITGNAKTVFVKILAMAMCFLSTSLQI